MTTDTLLRNLDKQVRAIDKAKQAAIDAYEIEQGRSFQKRTKWIESSWMLLDDHALTEDIFSDDFTVGDLRRYYNAIEGRLTDEDRVKMGLRPRRRKGT